MAGLRWRGALLVLQVCTLCHANRPPSQSGVIVSRQVAKLGKTTKLVCPVDHAEPELTVWMKYGQSLNTASDRFKVSKREGHLRIKHTEMTDAGNYTCVATNGYGSIRINYTVVVLNEEDGLVQEGDRQFRLSPNEDLYKEGSPPYFDEVEKMKQSMNLIKPTGSSIRLRCLADGNPRPVIHWMKNGQPYNEHREQHALLKVHDLKENANFTCVASNRLGQVNFTYNVGVVGQIREPRLTAPHPLSQTVPVGKSVSFQCFIESIVRPKVKWLKRVDKLEDISDPNISPLEYDGEKFVVLKDAGDLLELPNNSFLNKLVLQNVQPKDAGKFVCWATNKGGFNHRHAFLKIDTESRYQDPYIKNGRSGNRYTNVQRTDSRDSSHTSQDSKNSNSNDNDVNWPLLIGIPSCILLVLILFTVFLMQRNNRCRCSNSSDKAPRPPVPTHEREAYYYSNCQPQQQTVNPLITSREKPLKTPTPSVDMTCSEFSSVSRTHPNPHYYHHNSYNHANNHNMNYGY